MHPLAGEAARHVSPYLSSEQPSCSGIYGHTKTSGPTLIRGRFDRQPPMQCKEGWVLGVGSPFTAIFLDDYQGAPAATMQPSRRLSDGAINGMSGYVSDSTYPDILPQHYIARLMVVAEPESPKTVAQGGWQPACACINVHQYINATTGGEKWDEMYGYTAYRDGLQRGTLDVYENGSKVAPPGWGGATRVGSSGRQPATPTTASLPGGRVALNPSVNFVRISAPERGRDVELWRWPPQMAMWG